MSAKQFARYIDEFSDRHNTCEFDAIDQMAVVA